MKTSIERHRAPRHGLPHGELLSHGAVGARSPAPAHTSTGTSGGQVTVGVLGRDDVDSSKFTEYRDVPKGVSIPCFNLFSKQRQARLQPVRLQRPQDDQRYTGWFNTSAFDLSFDYNQIPHNMGNDARTIHDRDCPQGVWGMSDTLQQSLGTTVDATPTAARTVTVLRRAPRPDVRVGRQRGHLEPCASAGRPRSTSARSCPST